MSACPHDGSMQWCVEHDRAGVWCAIARLQAEVRRLEGDARLTPAAGGRPSGRDAAEGVE